MLDAQPRLLQVKAAAGSGKTYSLTLRFLTLLSQTDRLQGAPVCSHAPAEGFFWDEIMAVTFTNKAAMEMKERIVRELKNRALNLDSPAPPALNPRRARELLDDVLRRYSRLNIRTIDSLLNLVVRLFALPLGLAPNFELLFNERDIFDPVYKEFTKTIEKSTSGTEQLEQAALTLIHHDRKAGFWLARTIRKRLATIIRDLRDVPHLTTRQRDIANDLQGPYNEFMKSLNRLETAMRGKQLPLAKQFATFLGKCRSAKLFDGPPTSKFIKKESLRDCILKAGKDLVDSALEQDYARLQIAHEAYTQRYAVLAGAYSWAPLAQLANDLRQAMEAYQLAQGTVLCDSLARRAAQLLAGGEAAPETFCRLGNRLHHLLIDEFQDTSRDQWNALQPIGEECLSKHGSLFYVGDVKQAIYGWRGGDASLFDQIATLPELVAPAGGARSYTLENNWRSSQEIIRFNNDFFQCLSREAVARDVAETIFPKADTGVHDAFVHNIVQGFQDSVQKVADKNLGTGGYVRLHRLPGGKREDTDEQTQKAFRELIDELREREIETRWGDVAVLVRTNTQARQVSQWLVREEIPVVTENSLRMGGHPVIAQLASLLHFLDRPEDNLAFAEFISGQDVFLEEAGLSRSEILEWLASAPKKPFYLAFRNDFPGAWAYMEPLFSHAGMIGPYDMIFEAINAFRLFERHPDTELFLRRLLELAHRAEEKNMRSLSRFLEFWQDQGAEETVPLPQGMNAVTVMTMHKAKGLEFPIVILPFLDWSLPRFSDELAVVKLNEGAYATPLKHDVGQEYWDKCLELALEHCNLLYVSFTRPRHELYGFLPRDRGKSPRPSPVLAALESVLGDYFTDNIHERGQLPDIAPRATSQASTQPASAQRILPTRKEPYRPMAWMPRLRVYRNLEDADNWRNRQRGEIVHKALEYLLDYPKTEQAADLAVQAAVDDFPLSAKQRRELTSQTQELIHWLLSRKDMRHCLRHGRPEAEIIAPDGTGHRVDLLCTCHEGPIAVEYKTGSPSPDHLEQVRRYLELLDALPGTTSEARGRIVYLDKHEIVEVDGGRL